MIDWYFVDIRVVLHANGNVLPLVFIANRQTVRGLCHMRRAGTHGCPLSPT